MMRVKPITAKITYALIFTVAIPLLLFLWASVTEQVVQYPAVQSRFWGIAMTVPGVLLMAWGWYALRVHGKGLPMNAFPPPKFVSKGPYRLTKHPVYWGFGIAVCGLSIATGSSSGLWLITPITAMGMVSLIWGYERIDLERRFPGMRSRTLLGFPARAPDPLLVQHRIAGILYVVGGSLLVNRVVSFLTIGTQPLVEDVWTTDPEGAIPLLPLGLLFIGLVPLFLKRQDHLRAWLVRSCIALGFILYLALLWPAIGAQYFAVDRAWPFSTMMTVHVALIATSLQAYLRSRTKPGALAIVIAILLGAYQLFISESALLHLVTAMVIALLAMDYFRIWMALRNLAEQIANSWKEWTFGPIRVINHGFYVGGGTMLTILTCGWLAGSEYAWALFAFALVVIVFSALWAQIIEGSEKLKRPFGYYGALVGVIFAGLVVWWMGYNVWVIIGVVSVAMPWAQAIGRLRCLINGCCHGRITADESVGIRYHHFRSRVCGISGLKGEMLHPTPLYSIVWLFFVGFVLLAMWMRSMTPSFIFGMYLILTGLGRFVEEAYRGEVQTPVLSGLRLYQWTAIASVIVGMVFTAIPTAQVVVIAHLSWDLLLAALLAGLFTFFAMGVDFPRSNARFSRLV